MAQIVTGWPLIYQNIRRWSRTVRSDGAIDPDAIADACNEALHTLHDLIIEAGQPWAIKTEVIADVTGDLGTTTEFQTRKLFIEEDLGITDLAKIYRLWRVDPTNQIISRPIFHCGSAGPENVERGSWIARWGDERWREDGGFNGDGNYDMAVLIYNWGTALQGGSLSVTYWFSPATITESVFTDTDANGDLTTRPQVPPKLWPFLQNYAKLVLLETTGDAYKTNALWQRFRGPDGLVQRARTLLGSMQLGEANYARDSLADEVNYG